MQSAINWALLGLVIERPSYAYELGQRFERKFEGALALSSVSHVYTALGTLQSRDLVEEIPGTRGGRQPRPRYRATATGLAAYREWLAGQPAEDRRRQRVFVQTLAALAGTPRDALAIIDGFERECLADAGRTPIACAEEGCAGTSAELVARLVAEESRLTAGAKLAWIQYARRELTALAARAPRGDDGAA